MDKIKVTIKEFDADSGSLVVSFGCEESDPNTNNYPSLAYQPTMWPDITDPVEVLKRIAFSGISIVEMQKIKEQFAADEQRLNAYKSLVGQTFEFDVAELMAPTLENQND